MYSILQEEFTVWYGKNVLAPVTREAAFGGLESSNFPLSGNGLQAEKRALSAWQLQSMRFQFESIFRFRIRGYSMICMTAWIHWMPKSGWRGTHGGHSKHTGILGRIRNQSCRNGKGIREEAALHLFERYYRGRNTEQKPEGTGLGLAIASLKID